MEFINECECIVDYDVLEKAVINECKLQNTVPKAVYRIYENDGGYACLCVSNNKCNVHRLIGNFMIGYKLPRKLSVHHIDENKLNNNIENLQIIRQSLHSSHHNVGREYDIEVQRNNISKAIDSIRRKDVTDENVLDLRNKGYTYKEIVKTLKCSRNTVRRRLGVLDIHGYATRNACIDAIGGSEDEM